MRATSLYEAMTNDKINPTVVESQQKQGDKLLERGQVVGVDKNNRLRIQVGGQIITGQQVTDDPAQYGIGVGVWITRSPEGPVVHGVVRG